MKTIKTLFLPTNKSNLGLETGYSVVFRGFPQSLQANVGIVP
jgi:hypothetical protein